MKRVIWTNYVEGAALEPLKDIAEVITGADNGELMPRARVLELAADADAIVNQAELRVDAELLAAAPRLKIVANVALGTDNMDVALMATRGVVATNTPGVFTESTADCTLGLILSATRRLNEADGFVRSGAWKGFQPGRWDGALLQGKTLGILGYGQIGRAVARRAEAFGMRIIHCDKQNSQDGQADALLSLLGQSDVVSVHVPLTDETRRMIGAREFAAMKPGAFFVNMARGRVVDEQALVDALASGHLGGAGLDVFENEPAVHPALLKMRNVVMTPHIGGGTRESRLAARRLCAENVARVLTGRPPLSAVQPVA